MYRNGISNSQRGFVLVATVFVLAALSIMGISLSKISSTELYIATNERCKEVARYNGESAAISTSKLIRLVTDLDSKGIVGIPQGDPLAQGIEYPPTQSGDNPETEFYYKVIGTMPGGDNTCDDVTLSQNLGFDALTDIRTQGPEAVAGARALEFASGYTQGVGVGSTTGGTALYFVVASRGGGCDNANHIIYSRYRKVVGVSGGM
jgi:hypothetical protein